MSIFFFHFSINNGNSLVKATGGNMRSHLLTMYSVLFSCFINSLLDVYHRRKDIFMETVEGISCEAQ